MAHFPIFIDLTDKKCVLVGGGSVSARKARLLRDFGAQVEAIDPAPVPEMKEMSFLGGTNLHERYYEGPDDLKGAALVIAATGEGEINQRVYEDAKSLGIPVNVVDNPKLCSFFFPAVVHRGELVAGITTSGGYPAMAAHMRSLLEEAWPEDLAAKLKILAKVRRQILGKIPDPDLRRGILIKLMEKVLQDGETDEDVLRSRIQDLLRKEINLE